MSPTYKKKFIVGVFAMTLTALACGPLDLAREMLGRLPTSTPPFEAVTVIEGDTVVKDWYVATDGDNTNSCATPEAPCLTLSSAVRKASSLDRIHVAAGVYLMGVGSMPYLHNRNLTIIGEGSAVTILEANNQRGMLIDGTSDVHLQGFTIQNNQASPAKGCIHTSDSAELTAEDLILHNCSQSGLTHDGSGRVHLIDVVISDAYDHRFSRGNGINNSGELIIEGGEIRNSENVGINNSGPLTVSGTIIRNNQSVGVTHSYAGASTFTDVTIADNGVAVSAVGVSITAGDVSITGSTIMANGNRAITLHGLSVLRLDSSTISDHSGMTLDIRANAIAELSNVTIRDNGTGSEFLPIISNAGNLTMTESHIINNLQQALFNTDEAIAFIYDSEFSGNRSPYSTILNTENSEMLIARSLIANNTVSEPLQAALNSDGVLELENTTISNNNQQGVRMDGETTLSYITVAENGGIGIFREGSGPFVIANILVARNRGGDCDGFFTLPNVSLLPPSTIREYNIDTDGTCGFQETHSSAGIRLGRLADNGGLTFTHALLHDPDSPAIDAATGACPSTDQREFGREGLCDVGAYETNAVALSLEESEIVVGTPDGPDTVTITTTTPCYAGPGPQYGQISSLKEGAVAQLIGAGFTGDGNDDWIVASHPTAANTNCWVPSEDIETNLPFSEMRLVTVPGLPTPTPKPTSDRPAPEDTAIPCYYDQNQALICP